MKHIINYILEYKGHAIRDKEKSIGDPDEIQHFFGQGWVKLKFNKDNAYPFVYNKKLDKIIFGSANTIHNNIFTANNADKLKEMGLDGVDNIRQLRYCCGMDDDTEEIDKWYEENKKYIDETICGRIWYNAQDDFESWDSEEQAAQMAEVFGDLKDLDSSKCYVANWNEVAPNEFKRVLDNIVKHFSKEHNKKIKSYIAIDNNGEPIELEVGNNDVKIDKRSSDHEKEIEHAWQYHTDTSAHGRAKKRELTHGWIKSRDEHFQKTRYNHTDSKTAAEFHNKFTKRYDTKSGKYVWGEKIGDSLQMKNIIDYINENQKFLIKGHTADQTEKHSLLEKKAKFCSKARCIEVMQKGWDIKDKTEKSLFYIKYCLANFLTDMKIKYIETIKGTGSYRRDTFVFEYKGVKFAIISGENWYNDESYYKIYGLGDDDEGSKAQNNGKYNNDYVWYKASWGSDFSGQSKHISILFNKDNIETTKQIIELVCDDYCYNNPYKDLDKVRYKKRDRCLFNHGDRKIFR